MNEPLIWTSKGNVPLASLTLETAWDIQDTYIKFVERYRDSTGEIVKESAHAYSKVGLIGDGSVAPLA
jgi:hypothetical protein